MPSIQAVTVYSSSSTTVARVFFDAAAELGAAIVREGWDVVYGGNNVGPMGALADGARAAGGRVIGVTPRLFIDKGCADQKCHELLVTETMRQRKHLMEQRGDAFVTLPGGLGTFEEFFEIVVGRQLAIHDKPVVLLNVDGYYDGLIELIDRAIAQKFVRAGGWQGVQVVRTVPEAIHALKHAKPAVPVEL
jgi:uncharacterized protein (TIGR00730 family)